MRAEFASTVRLGYRPGMGSFVDANAAAGQHGKTIGCAGEVAASRTGVSRIKAIFRRAQLYRSATMLITETY
jgi:hypothetical protein